MYINDQSVSTMHEENEDTNFALLVLHSSLDRDGTIGK